jgi:Flp pilus assembly protein TadD
MERHEAGAISLQAEIQMARGHWSLAIASLEEALVIAERIGDRAVADSARVHLAEALLETGDVERARVHVNSLAHDRTTDADVIVLQARLAAHDGDVEEAARLMVLARTNAGEGWTADDDALLASYRQAAR